VSSAITRHTVADAKGPLYDNVRYRGRRGRERPARAGAATSGSDAPTLPPLGANWDGNLLFWLGVGAAQKGAGSKEVNASRHWLVSLVVGILIAVLIGVGAFLLLVSQQ
jgi:hypothetical protein